MARSTRDPADGDPVGVPQRFSQQHVGLDGLGVGFDVVGPSEEHRVELLRGHELHDVDLMTGRHGQRVQLLLGDGDDGAVRLLDRPVDLVVRHFLTAHLADPLVPNPATVSAVHLMEPDVVLLGGGVEPHRDGDHPERH